MQIEGIEVADILDWTEEYFDQLVLIDQPMVLNIGSAQVLGQFAISNENRLVVELGQIDGGGEGVLPTISRVAKHVARVKRVSEIECVVHAVTCENPNLKLRSHLEKTGFVVKNVPGKGEAYYKLIPIKPMKQRNSLVAIHPYKYEGLWVFDDEKVDLIQEPFVSGADSIIDKLTVDIPNAESGFTIVFSAKPFPGYEAKFDWVREESEGNWYYIEKLDMEGWLCPALFKYFNEAPKDIYAQFKEKAN